MLRVTAQLLVLTALLAGCSDAPTAAGPGAGTGPDPACEADCGALPLDATSRVPAPTWVKGQWWAWDVTFPDASFSFKSIVLEADGSGRLVVTDDALRAKDEAAFDILLLGEIGTDLQMTRSGAEWDLLSFPLTDGKTWTATIPNIAWDVLRPAETVTVDLRATFEPDLAGYRVMGHAAEHMLLEFTYLPATGWFGDFVVYDIDEGDDPEEFRMRATATGLDYTGPYYLDEATRVVDLYDVNGLDDAPPEGQPVLNVDPHVAFTLGADVAYVFGFIEAYAVVGDREVLLAPPGNQEPYQFQATGDLEGAGGFWTIDFPAVAGEWRVATTGAGGHSRANVQLFSIVEVAATM